MNGWQVMLRLLTPELPMRIILLHKHVKDLARMWLDGGRLLLAVTHSRQCLLCPTVSIVCCVTQQTVSAVPHNKHCLVLATADHVCCTTRHAGLMRGTASNVCCHTTHKDSIPPLHEQATLNNPDGSWLGTAIARPLSPAIVSA